MEPNFALCKDHTRRLADLDMATRQLAEHAIATNGKLDLTNERLTQIRGELKETRIDVDERHQEAMSKIDSLTSMIWRVATGLGGTILVAVFIDRIVSG